MYVHGKHHSSRLYFQFIWISFQQFFPKIWVAKLGVRLIGECGLYAGVYGISSHLKIHVVTYHKVPVDVCDSLIKPQQKHDEQNNHQQPWCNGSKVKEVKSATISWFFVFQSKTREAGKRQEKAHLKDDRVNITCYCGNWFEEKKTTFSLTRRQQ